MNEAQKPYCSDCDLGTEGLDRRTFISASVLAVGAVGAAGMQSPALLADEPVELGGQDAGPAPHEWILAALGTCTSMTLQMYAARKGWTLDAIEVSVSGDHVDGTL